MDQPTDRQAPDGLGRLIAFADAVVAIALTLLVLPLVDIANDLQEPTTVAQVVSDRSTEIISFLISFAVIWILWREHHRMMEHFRAYDRTLAALHFAWLLTIVTLPFATALLDSSDVKWASTLYVGILLVSVLCLAGMRRWGRTHRALIVESGKTDAWLQSSGGLGTLLVMAATLVVTVILPASGSWPLVLLVLSAPVDAWLDRLRRAAG